VLDARYEICETGDELGAASCWLPWPCQEGDDSECGPERPEDFVCAVLPLEREPEDGEPKKESRTTCGLAPVVPEQREPAVEMKGAVGKV
jgi:hypothetical protein